MAQERRDVLFLAPHMQDKILMIVFIWMKNKTLFFQCAFDVF
jgi:hypothetical protein